MENFYLNHLCNWLDREFNEEYHAEIVQCINNYLSKMSYAERDRELYNDWQVIYRHALNN